jgi:hypothetical protein
LKEQHRTNGNGKGQNQMEKKGKRRRKRRWWFNVKLQCHTQILSFFHNNYLKKKTVLFTVMLDTIKELS